MLVEKNIPIPDKRRKRIYPWDSLSVGDSFFVAGGDLNGLCSAAGYRMKTRAEKYTCRQSEGGVRVWRTE